MADVRVEKRNRPPKSCEPCRIRKLKCNRELPCDSCVRRDKAGSCQYAPNADRTEKKAGSSSSGSNKTVGSRLRRLEDMISNMETKMSAQTGVVQIHSAADELGPSLVSTSMSTPVTTTMTETAAGLSAYTTPEKLSSGKLDGSNTHYIDASHWSSLLEEIKDLREQLESPAPNEKQPVSVTNTGSASEWPTSDDMFADLVFSKSSQTLGEVVQDLPPRPVCDHLVSCYFRIGHSILSILHPMQFQEEYASFWEAPTDAPALWVALLFAILSVSSCILRMSRNECLYQGVPMPEEMAAKARQCLVLGSYVNVERYSIEAMIVLLQGHYFQVSDSGDSSHTSNSASSLWFLMGMILRLAVRRGYHRDPSKLPRARLSPFEAEMRRRVWVGIVQVDSLMSFQLGLPSMIPAAYCDTELPRNLEDTDLHPDMTVLPPPRPISDTTPILYTVVKATIMSRFKAVVGHTRALEPRPYEETLALDASLRTAYRELPAHFQYKPLARSLIDSTTVILNRTTIEMLYLKSLIVLHRKYLTPAHDQHNAPLRQVYAPSRNACLIAACTMLDRQVELSQATRDGGLLHDSQWMVSALTVSDFILAGIVICFDLTLGAQNTQNDSQSDRCLQAVKQSYQAWKESSAKYSEARVAAEVIRSTVERVEAAQRQRDITARQTEASPSRFMFTATHEPMSGANTFLAMDDIDFVNWDFIDNNCHDPFNEDLDLTTWMLDATNASRSMDSF